MQHGSGRARAVPPLLDKAKNTMNFDSIPRGLKRCVEPERGILTNRYFWAAVAACAVLWAALALLVTR